MFLMQQICLMIGEKSKINAHVRKVKILIAIIVYVATRMLKVSVHLSILLTEDLKDTVHGVLWLLLTMLIIVILCCFALPSSVCLWPSVVSHHKFTPGSYRLFYMYGPMEVLAVCKFNIQTFLEACDQELYFHVCALKVPITVEPTLRPPGKKQHKLIMNKLIKC